MVAIIDGRALARSLSDDTARAVAAFRDRHAVVPCLAVVLVGEDAASTVYVARKVAKTARVGGVVVALSIAIVGSGVLVAAGLLRSCAASREPAIDPAT